MDRSHSSLTICARARGFRPVLLFVVLFWCCVFYASAIECDMAVWSNGSTSSDSTADFCGWVTGVSGFYGGGSAIANCSVNEGAGTADFDYLPSAEHQTWMRSGGPASCAEDGEVGVLIPLEDAITLAWGIGGAWIMVACVLFLRRGAA